MSTSIKDKPMKKSGVVAGIKRALRSEANVHGAIRATENAHGAVRKLNVQTVELCLNKVTCVDPTKQVFSRDQMTLVGIETLARVSELKGKKALNAQIRKGGQFALGKFKKGEAKDFPKGKVIASFPFGNGETWPRSYEAIVVLIEEDGGKLDELINGFIASLEKDVSRSLSNLAEQTTTAVLAGLATGSAVGSVLGSVIPGLGTAVGSAVGAGIGAAIDAFQKAKKDDCFPPKKVSLELKRPPESLGDCANSNSRITFTGFGGTYTAELEWRLK